MFKFRISRYPLDKTNGVFCMHSQCVYMAINHKRVYITAHFATILYVAMCLYLKSLYLEAFTMAMSSVLN